jgi:hypothetical protein
VDTKKIILKFEIVAEQPHGSVKRLIGFVQAKSLLGLFDAVDLEANPRSAKWGPVTEAIVESIIRDADIFPFKTKGVLVGSVDYRELQRQRYELRCDDPTTEGILDGGHNMLAIGTHILSLALGDEKISRKVKNWESFKDLWRANRDAIEAIREELTFWCLSNFWCHLIRTTMPWLPTSAPSCWRSALPATTTRNSR